MQYWAARLATFRLISHDEIENYVKFFPAPLPLTISLGKPKVRIQKSAFKYRRIREPAIEAYIVQYAQLQVCSTFISSADA